MTIINHIAYYKNNKHKINESKGVLDKKYSQEEECKITMSSTEELTKALLKDKKKRGKEWSENQEKLIHFTINNIKLSIEMKNKSKKCLY